MQAIVDAIIDAIIDVKVHKKKLEFRLERQRKQWLRMSARLGLARKVRWRSGLTRTTAVSKLAP